MIRIVNGRHWQGEGVWIDRRSALGNPYHIGEDGTRAEVIEKYRVWLWKQIRDRNVTIISALVYLISIVAARGNLTMICWCAPKACHGDVLKACLNWMNVNDGLYEPDTE